MDCIFCKIVAGEIPSYKVYEDDNVLAFLDIAPCNPGHTLVIPKQHYKNIEDASEEILAQLMSGVKKVGMAIKEKLGYGGYNIMENNDPIAGQEVPHLHWHIIPRKEGDGYKLWQHGKYATGEAEEIFAKFKA
ncbi:MAG: HIT family protein [Candidatus Komeilibacteria bacterium]